ncbi:hypothetical protein I5M32_15920 [Pedobacter sp. SD-b]|uniref:DUF4329 domain-containing protein n=1 Tax=Pedobacter segetis TaxID=2793069 RepID=A0ABS1BNI5_9SPHI|nr:hypothetical protein [Pedobacter segetis]MBK0384453.1 hypothetical protein [Pedobacter segetis]
MKKHIKKIMLLGMFILCLNLPSSVYAEDYGSEYHEYEYDETELYNELAAMNPGDMTTKVHALQTVVITAYSFNFTVDVYSLLGQLINDFTFDTSQDVFNWYAINFGSGDNGDDSGDNPEPPDDPCAEAKKLTAALNEALAKQEVQDQLNALKGFKNSSNEHGFIITKDATGYHVSDIIPGTANNVNLPGDPNVVFIAHEHTLNASAAPSSTDIYGLGGHNASFEGNIIIYGDDMYLLSVTDQAKYDSFVLKSNQKGYYDKDASNGWKKETKIDDEFGEFVGEFSKLNPGSDATYPTQQYLMDRFNMGLTLQKWSGTDNAFYPEELNVEENDDTGSSTTLGGGGNVIKSKYKKIEVNKKDCPD